MSVAIVTGSAGLVGSDTARFLCDKGLDVVGIDNDMRKAFFGADASTEWNRRLLEKDLRNYQHEDVDIRDIDAVERIFSRLGNNVSLIVHAAAQPSHDWAATNPVEDFSINALGTLILLENYRRYCPEAIFIFTSTNKVYGDSPNRLPLVELETRYELPVDHKWYMGIDETMSVDDSMHSLFGVSKLSADLMVQEYGKYFSLKTGIFRCGCLTGPAHSGTRLHGFLSYLMRCCISGHRYYIYGYKGKQVRDNIHSLDLADMFWHFFKRPGYGEVYNAGGSRGLSCSVLEAIELCQEVSGRKLDYEYVPQNRKGDHIWWISSVRKFKRDYPGWNYRYDLKGILEEIYEVQKRVV